ncbi:hypothetical protein GCM10027592_03700 [Spirosoma flavus]
MKNESYSNLMDWTTSQIGHYAMTGYVLKEVNEPATDQLSLILAEYHQKESIAEVLISTEGNSYQAEFMLLPGKEGPSPQQLMLKTTDLDTLIGWLSTGNTSELEAE